MKKQDIINGAAEYATYVTNHIPQRNLDNNISYYFSGSLAMLLLSSAKNISFVGTNHDGEISYISPQIKVTPDAKNSFTKGARPLSIDIDVVAINDSVFAGQGKHYTLSNIKKNCHLATELCPAWSKSLGTAYFDILSDDRNILNHNMAALELENGNSILIVNPIDLMLHKVSESLFVQTKPKQIAKYDKDLKDLASLICGIINLGILPENFEEYIGEVVKNNPNSYLASEHETELAKLSKDLIPYTDKQMYEKVKHIISSVASYNKSIQQIQNH